MSIRKPHNHLAGYVAERRCILGGHIVIYDAHQTDLDPDWGRWYIAHEPSGLFMNASSLRQARSDMKAYASGDGQGSAFVDQIREYYTNT